MRRARVQKKEQTVDHLKFKCKKLGNQKYKMIREIKALEAFGLQRMKYLLMIIKSLCKMC